MDPAPRRYDDALAEALRASQRAVEADVKGDYSLALREYELALALLQQVFLDSQAPSAEREAMHAQLKSKMTDYQRRVTSLSSLVARASSSATSASSSSSSSSTSTSISATAMLTSSPTRTTVEGPLSPLDVEFYSATPAPSPLTAKDSDAIEPAVMSPPPRVVGRRGERALEAALRETARAQTSDARAQSDADKAHALRSYLIALDYFAHAAEHAPNGVLASINRTMKTLMARAETLKAALLSSGCDASEWTPKVGEVHVDSERVLSAWHSERIAARGVDSRLGALFSTSLRALWNDSRQDAIRLTLALERNVLVLDPTPGASKTMRVRVALELRAAVRVTALRVALVQVRSACVRVRGPVTRASRALVTQMHAHAQRFPLTGPAEFKGALTLALPAQLEPSECDGSASFALEYEVLLSAIVAFHDDVSVTVPLRIELAQ